MTKALTVHENIIKALKAYAKKNTFDLKYYENISNCITLKYNKHVVCDVYFIKNNIRYSTKSVFFTDDISSDAKRKALIKSVTTNARSCNLIKNVTDFQIKATDVATLDLIVKKACAYYDAKQSRTKTEQSKAKQTRTKRESAKREQSKADTKAEQTESKAEQTKKESVTNNV